jgi:hypothetical protein
MDTFITDGTPIKSRNTKVELAFEAFAIGIVKLEYKANF